MGRLTKYVIDEYIAENFQYEDIFGISDKSAEAFGEIVNKLGHYETLEEQGKLVEQKYATIVGESGICSECGESYMDVADAFQSGYTPNFCPWCGAIFVSEAKLKDLGGGITMDAREKLVELIHKAKLSMRGKNGLSNEKAQNSYIADYLIDNGVTVQEHGRWEYV